jgi:hypothetical protein
MPGKGKARPRNAKDQRRRGRLRRERTDVRKAVDGTEELAGQLQTLLRELSRREGGSWQRREQTVIAEVKDRGGLAVKRFEQAFGEAARLQVVNFWWHPRFRKHLDPEPPREGVLCAFGALQDIVLTKKGMNAFVEWLVDPKDAALPKKADLQQALTSILSNKRKPAMDIVDVNEAAQQILDVLLYSKE